MKFKCKMTNVVVTHVFIDDLEPDSQYYFKIVALTELGTEQPSNIVSISTRSADAGTNYCVLTVLVHYVQSFSFCFN